MTFKNIFSYNVIWASLVGLSGCVSMQIDRAEAILNAHQFAEIGTDEASIRVNTTVPPLINIEANHFEKGLPAVFAQKNKFGFSSQCGDRFDYQDIEKFDHKVIFNNEKFSPLENPFSSTFIMENASKVVLIRWVGAGQIQSELWKLWGFEEPIYFNEAGSIHAPNDQVHWCTGTLIGGNRVLTAGHCFKNQLVPYQEVGGGKNFLPPKNSAKLMQIVLDYRIDKNTTFERYGRSYAVTNLIEYKNEWKTNGDGNKVPYMDYAVLSICNTPNKKTKINFCRPKTEVDADHLLERRPTAVFESRAIFKDEPIAIIQHPGGLPKKIDVGSTISPNNDIIRYTNLDTKKGASGSPVFNSSGKIVGLHVSGGCKTDGNDEQLGNGAVSIVNIVETSRTLQ